MSGQVLVQSAGSRCSVQGCGDLAYIHFPDVYSKQSSESGSGIMYYTGSSQTVFFAFARMDYVSTGVMTRGWAVYIFRRSMLVGWHAECGCERQRCARPFRSGQLSVGLGDSGVQSNTYD